ncbi:DUF4407 domain-containing protein [Modestobacter versicolor]|uniref:DUF4407 domain-containing protein n=1 Tax=Modestobacter versicolor TaxID=429133 RepID=UPI0034DFE206
MRARKRSIGDRLAELAGARLDVLQVAPGSRAKHVALGGVLLSTGALAAVSAAFAVHMALGAPWAVALVIGIGWGLVIVNLDRMLLVGMAHDSSVVRNVAMAVPRIALAVLLGTVISTPLTLQVFDKEIDATIVTLQAEAADEFTTELDADARYAQMPALQERIATAQAVLAGGGATDPNADPRVTAATADRDAKQTAYDAAQATYREMQAKAQCELDGSCGSGEAGPGDAYQTAAAAAAQQASVVADAKAQLDDAEGTLLDARTAAGSDAASNGARSVSMAEADLATDQAALAALTSSRAAEVAAFEAQNSESDGLLARLEAMDRLAEDRPAAGTAHLMLFLLFLSVELLPILMKTLVNFSEPTSYDKLEKMRDDEDVAAETIRRDGRQRAVQARADLVVAAETDRMAREIIEREAAAREEAARREARRQARRGRFARALRSVVPGRPAESEVIEPTLDTGELEAMMIAPSAVGVFGTSAVPVPRPAAELLLPLPENR